MLGEPILAFIVRTLIEKKQSDNIKNRADLYKRFFNYIFLEYKHGRLKLSRHLRSEARTALQKISYDAIANGKMEAQRIPFDFCRRRINELGLKKISIDDLPRCGFVEFIVDRTRSSEEFLSFNHQSFQEYLAAEWATQSKKRFNYLIRNHWKPKWREVIKFLVGIVPDSEDVIRTIYTGPDCDNVIHSKLFFAAECAGEITISSKLENLLISKLHELSSVDIFEFSVIKALVKMKTEKSRRLAWDIIVAMKPVSTRQLFVTDSEFIRFLVEKERLQEAIEVAFNCCKFSFGYPQLSFLLPEDLTALVAEKIQQRDQLESISIVEGYILHLAGQWLTESQIDKIVPMLEDKTDAEIPLKVLIILSAAASKLKEEHISQIIGLLNRKYHPASIEAARFLYREVPVTKLRSSHIKEILKNYLVTDLYSSRILAEPSSVFKKHITEKDIDFLCDKVVNAKLQIRSRALLMLQGLGDKLNSNQFNIIANCIEDKELGHIAIRVAATISTQLESNGRNDVIQKILAALSNSSCKARNAVMDSIRYLKRYIDRQHISTIIENIDLAECIPSAFRACCYLANELETEQIWHILHKMEKTGIFKVDSFMIRNLNKHLNSAQNHWVINLLSERICNLILRDVSHIIPFFDLINVDILSRDDEEELFKWCNNSIFDIRHQSYNKLFELHQKRRLD
jgi:hypothetical protein